MTEQQIPKLVASFVEHQNAFSSISTEDAQWAIQNTVEAINLFVTAMANRTKRVVDKVAEQLLELVGAVTMPATSEKFHAVDNFLHRLDGGVWFYLSGKFKSWFLEREGKIEDSMGEQTLHYYKLSRSSVDGHIIDELGGEVKTEVTLAEILFLMEKQKCGEDGVMLTNGWANIFYVKDQSGVLRAIHVYRTDQGWSVYAIEVFDPGEWKAGQQVFSRKSSK